MTIQTTNSSVYFRVLQFLFFCVFFFYHKSTNFFSLLQALSIFLTITPAVITWSPAVWSWSFSELVGGDVVSVNGLWIILTQKGSFHFRFSASKVDFLIYALIIQWFLFLAFIYFQCCKCAEFLQFSLVLVWSVFVFQSVWLIHLTVCFVRRWEVPIEAIDGCFTKLDNVHESGWENVTRMLCKCICFVFKEMSSSPPTGILLTEVFAKIPSPQQEAAWSGRQHTVFESWP